MFAPITLAACLLTAGCGDSGTGAPAATASASPAAALATPSASASAATSATPARAVPAWDATTCGDDEYQNARMERHPALIGRSADDLLAAYGKPRADETFRAGEGLGVYRGGVASQLPGGAKANAQTPVREIVWVRSACQFIVRFREAEGAWRVFDAFEAAEDADF